MKTLGILSMFMLTFSMGFGQEVEEKKELKREYPQLTAEEKADQHTAKMTKMLDLSEGQQQKIRAINLAHIKEMDAIKEEMKKLKKKAKEQREKTRTEIDAVLDDEQKAKFNEQIEKKREERKRKRKERCCQEK